MAAATQTIQTCPSRQCIGNLLIDENLLTATGITNFDHYAVTPGSQLFPDLFL